MREQCNAKIRVGDTFWPCRHDVHGTESWHRVELWDAEIAWSDQANGAVPHQPPEPSKRRYEVIGDGGDWDVWSVAASGRSVLVATFDVDHPDPEAAARIEADWLNASADCPPPEEGRIGGVCRHCGLPGHRFGSTHGEGRWSAVACVNSMRPVLERLREENEQLRGEAAGVTVSGETVAELEDERDRLRATLRVIASCVEGVTVDELRKYASAALRQRTVLAKRGEDG